MAERIEIHSLRIDRLATLADLLREEALSISTRARMEDAISSEGLDNALSLVSRIDALTSRLLSTLNPPPDSGAAKVTAGGLY